MAEGRVRVNGETAMIGQRADGARDEITVDGRPIARVEQKRYLMLNKPRGYVCPTRRDGRRSRSLSRTAARASIPWGGWTSTPRDCCS